MNEQSQDVKRLLHHVNELLTQRRCTPRATYRLEFDPRHFTFLDAAAIIPYLAQLGISHVYSSPYFKVSSEAGHGYAIVDYNALNPKLGDQADYDAFIAALHEHGMKQVLDFVPNHMSAAPGENRWWSDVLENGQSSRFNEYFDINWIPADPGMKNRLLLPMLGQQFGKALEAGELKVRYGQGRFHVELYSKNFPLDPATWMDFLAPVLESFRAGDPNERELLELESILHALSHLPHRECSDPEARVVRSREGQLICHRLRELVDKSPALSNLIEAALVTFNGDPGTPPSFNGLESLLNLQAYRLSFWRAAADEVNYRRFFDINELVAVCPERMEVFADSHDLVMKLLVNGQIDGLRIDHVDGLLDPRTYLWRLQWSYVRALARDAWARRKNEDPGHVSSTWEELEPEFLLEFWKQLGGPSPFKVLDLPVDPVRDGDVRAFDRRELPLPIWVEKILGKEEPLPEDWPVAGTTGYDFLNLVGGLFVEPEGLAKIRRNYARFTGEEAEFSNVVIQAKRLILESAMPSELQLLALRLHGIVEQFRHYRDFTLNMLSMALKDFIAAFAVYRTYAGPEGIPERDLSVLKAALRRARRFSSVSDAAVFDFLQQLMLGELREGQPTEVVQQQDLFLGRLQQVTSPVMAKGVEDTAFYRWLPLVSVNEVGGEPAAATQSIAVFHERNVERQNIWPETLLCTSTHDTKRSEDVRSRIHLLSEIPDLWRSTVARWSRWNRQLMTMLPEGPAPSRNDEFHFYQALVGAWMPKDDARQHENQVNRLTHYLLKATREAKLRTSWTAPDTEYEEALQTFIQRALRQDPKNRFLQDVQGFIEQWLHPGLLTSLSQLLLKLTVPGVPDIYQGQELWDFSLVDPDNRRPVDYAVRQQLLVKIQQQTRDGDRRLDFARQLAEGIADPLMKLYVTFQTLQLRREHPELFGEGHCTPLTVSGDAANLVCAFARTAADRSLIVVAPRWNALLKSKASGESPWGETRIEELPFRGELEECFTGLRYFTEDGRLQVGELLAEFPIALLVSSPPGSPSAR